MVQEVDNNGAYTCENFTQKLEFGVYVMNGETLMKKSITVG